MICLSSKNNLIHRGLSVLTELRLRGLEKLIKRLCPLYGSVSKISLINDRTAEIRCQYEGYAHILKGLFQKKENVAELQKLGYEEMVIKLGVRPKPIATARVSDFLP